MILAQRSHSHAHAAGRAVADARYCRDPPGSPTPAPASSTRALRKRAASGESPGQYIYIIQLGRPSLTLGGNQVRHGCRRRPARARPLHSPQGHTTRTLRTHGQLSMKRPAIPSTAMIQPSRTPRSHARGRRPALPPAASAGTTLTGRGTSNVLSYRYATRPDSSHTGYLETNVAAQQGYWRSGGSLTFRIPIPLRMWSAPDGSGRRPTSVSAGQSLCGAPRRNRTGDPILTMNRRPSAVLTVVFAGRNAPWRPQLCAHSTASAVISDRTAGNPPNRRIVRLPSGRSLDLLHVSSRPVAPYA